MIAVSEPDTVRNYVTITPGDESAPLESVDTREVRALFEKHGALLFRHFYFNLERLTRFMDQFCSGAVVNDSGGRRMIDSRSGIQSVNLGSDPFPLHPELSRTPWQPDVCWFACVKPPEANGETTLCDGIHVVRNLPIDLLDALGRRRLRYTRQASTHDCAAWLGDTNPDHALLANPPRPSPYEFFSEDGQVHCSFTRPFLHRTMFQDELCFGNFLLFSRLYNKDRTYPCFENGEVIPDALVERLEAVSREVTVSLNWEKNDIVMLDNTRFMHGRNRIDDPRSRLIISRFGYLRFARPRSEEMPDAPWRKSVSGAFPAAAQAAP